MTLDFRTVVGACLITLVFHTSVKAESVESIKIAFGSCSNQDLKQVMWTPVLAQAPDVWVWLGDNIYADTLDMEKMAEKYQQQRSHPLYQQLEKSAVILGTWDDHDYGENDAGKEYPKKVESQQLFLDFIGVPKDSPRRKQEGVYSSYDWSRGGVNFKFYLLDARYFRDPIERVKRSYQPNLSGTLLGDTQWRWLETEFKNSRADVNIIASGIQIIPEQHDWEKWANFPNERQRLFKLIKKYDLAKPVFISGDRHIGEISMLTFQNKKLYEVTASSLTHGWGKRRPEANKHRLGEIVYDLNFGMLELKPGPEKTVSLHLLTREGVAESVTIAD